MGDDSCGWWEWSNWSECSGVCLKHGDEDSKNTQTRNKVYLHNVDEAQCGAVKDTQECGNLPCSGKNTVKIDDCLTKTG